MSCSVLGLDDDPEPPPNAFTQDGYRYAVSSAIRVVDGFEEGVTYSQIYAELSVENVLQAPARASFSPCAWTLRLYREGEWDTGEVRETHGFGSGCNAVEFTIALEPGEVASPGVWQRRLLIPEIGSETEPSLGDFVAVQPGLYRVAALVSPAASPFEPEAEIIAPEPIRITPGDLMVASGRALE